MDEIPELVPLEAPQETLATVKVPVTIVTGFLGAGKTTLITRLLNDNTHGKRIAVILNDLSDAVGIDKSLIKNDKGELFEEWLELRNGCLCCSVKDAGVKAVENLIAKQGRFDYVLLETNGLADPSPIASMFWLDEQLQSTVYLDGILTVVDATYILNQLEASSEHSKEALQQVALADRILINKQDLVTSEQINSIKQTLLAINANAQILQTTRSEAPIEFILDLHAFDQKIFDKTPLDTFHQESVSFGSSVHTVSFAFPGTINMSKLDEYLQSILWDNTIPFVTSPSDAPPFTILRLKGLVHDPTTPNKIVIQGVRELFDKQEGAEWGEEEKLNRLVIIGMHLPRKQLREAFMHCLT